MVTSCGERSQAWILLTSDLPNGRSAQLAFKKSNPSLNKEECELVISKSIESLVVAAHQKEPRLRSTKFIGARCLMPAHDSSRKLTTLNVGLSTSSAVTVGGNVANNRPLSSLGKEGASPNGEASYDSCRTVLAICILVSSPVRKALGRK